MVILSGELPGEPPSALPPDEPACSFICSGSEPSASNGTPSTITEKQIVV